MFFKRKSKKKDEKCEECNSSIDKDYSFCPHCGASMLDIEREMREFGMLGRNDAINNDLMKKQAKEQHLSITDKMIVSLFNNVLRSIDQQFREEIGANGIKIKIGVPKKRKNQSTQEQNNISVQQLEKMNALPRVAAKTNVRRLSDKIIYELDTPGLQSVKDVFVSKLESGYEVKAIGDKKVYVNSLPVNLPLRGFALNEDKLFVEFKTQE